MHEALTLLAQRGCVQTQDVEHLQTTVFPTGLQSRDDAEMLLALDLALPESCEAWQDYLISAIAEFVTRNGAVTASDADWLAGCVSRGGVIDGLMRFDLLFTVIAYGASVPFSLLKLALDQVALAALENKGPLANLHDAKSKALSEREVSLIRELLIAAESTDCQALSRSEMSWLHRLNQRSDNAHNHSSWNDLFVKAAANYVLNARADLAQPRSFALAPSHEASDVENTCRGTLKSLERIGETCGGSEDMIRVVNRYKERGLESDNDDEQQLLGACIDGLQSFTSVA
ncbi:hypothetical protein ACFQ14_15870 [Pseudahrensia aquimaris]|uniref:Uncharacterized protein n=1 Tax=Pseudahrensia aquimaris TaxID=744461 RepID=A0ABW3FK25_9HYPH